MENNIADDALKDSETNSSLEVAEDSDKLKVAETKSSSLESKENTPNEAPKKRNNEKDTSLEVAENSLLSDTSINSEKDDNLEVNTHEDSEEDSSLIVEKPKDSEKDTGSVVDGPKDSEKDTSLVVDASKGNEKDTTEDSKQDTKLEVDVHKDSEKDTQVSDVSTHEDSAKDTSLEVVENSIAAHNISDDTPKDGEQNSSILKLTDSKTSSDENSSSDKLRKINSSNKEKEQLEAEDGTKSPSETENSTKTKSGNADNTCESIFLSINEECKKISGEKENGSKNNESQSSMEVDDALSPQEDVFSKDKDKLIDQEVRSPSSSMNEIEIVTVTGNSNLFRSDSPELNVLESNDDEPTAEKTKLVNNVIDLSASPQKLSNSLVDGNNPTEPNEDDDIEEIQPTDPMDLDQNSESADGKDFNNSAGSSKHKETSPSQNKGENSEKELETKENGNNGPGKIKLRSFASLCGGESEKRVPDKCPVKSMPNTRSTNLMTNIFSSEISGVTVGDIVQHSSIVESDESGIMHLKISNVVGGEDCITGLSIDEERDAMLPVQVSSIASLIEPISPVVSGDKTDSSTSTAVEESGESSAGLQSWEMEGTSIKTASSNETNSSANKDMVSKQTGTSNLESCPEDERDTQTVVNVFRSPLIVSNICMFCKKKSKCEFRIVFKQKSETKVLFICSSKCKTSAVNKFPEDHIIQKPRLYFERICGMCGKEVGALPKSKTYSWQTREFCNKLCLADHIGEVARSCYCCRSSVRVLYMVKYCVRFGSDVHQFCSNICLETYKSKIKVCSFCQKNLNSVIKVTSPSNKEYCSAKCLKRAQRRDISQQHYKEENDCTVCQKKMINKYEFIHNAAPTWLCSDPCLNVFKYVNQVRSVNCCLCARLLNAEDSCNYFFNGKQLRVFCSESCFSVFVISARKIVTCEYCKVKKYNFDMICSNNEELGEYFSCSVCCLNFVENPSKNSSETPAITSDSSSNDTTDVSVVKGTPSAAVVKNSGDPSSVTPILKECSMCSKTEPAQFHMVMSDSTLRSFCSYVCATRYKCTFGFQVSGGIQSLQASNNEDVKVSSVPQSKKKKTSEVVESNHIGKVAAKPMPKLDEKDLLALMQLLNPPTMCNKATMCRPLLNTKGVQCKPHQWHKSSQTEDEMKPAAIIPVPIPVYVPTPFMMFSAPTPIPLFIPIPIPVPVFIPTLEKNIKDLENKIKTVLEELPSDPAESELLLLAREEEMKRKREDEEILMKEIAKNSAAEQELIVAAGILAAEAKLKEKGEKVSSKENKGSGRKSDEEVVQGEPDENNIETETEIITRIEAELPKKNQITSEENSDEINDQPLDAKNKRKLSELEDVSSPKKKKVEEDEVGEVEEATKEHLNFTLGVSVWQAWVKRRKIIEDDSTSSSGDDSLDEIINMNCEILSNNLILFLEDLGSHDTQYDADTIYYILLGLQKFLFEQGSTHCIFLELNFENFTNVFDVMIRRFFESTTKTGVNPECKYLTGTRVTEEMLWEARQLGAHTPHVLINTLFYFNTKVFKLKTPEEHYNLTFKQILKHWKRANLGSDVSVTMTTLLKYFPKQPSKADDKSSEVCLEMYENKDNPLRCPVKLYEFYLSKCPDSIRSQSNTYYVYPEQSCLPDSPVWFSTTTFEMKTTEKMLNRVLLVREVQEALFG